MNIRKIGVIATSAPGSSLSKTAFNKGLEFFKKKNIELVFADNVLSSKNYVSGSEIERMAMIETFTLDPSIDLIMNFWGGHQTHQLLPRAKNLIDSKKPIVGYSDITPLLNWLTEAGCSRGFLGPAFITFCKPVTFDYSWNHLIRALSGEAFDVEVSKEITTNRWHEENGMILHNSTGWETLCHGKACGRALGGNMGALLLAAGTPYWPNFKDCILFLEDDESESIETIDRFLTQFQQIGVFEQCLGIVLGRFMNGVFDSETSKIQLYERVFKNFKGPVIYDADFGHSDPIFTIPLGRTTTIDTSIGCSRIQFGAK